MKNELKITDSILITYRTFRSLRPKEKEKFGMILKSSVTVIFNSGPFSKKAQRNEFFKPVQMKY